MARSENSERLVLSAVRQRKVSKRKGFRQKLFAVWFDALVYNQIWEDPRVDLEALAPVEGKSILTISSGGCNALNYLLEDPRRVTAVDLNRHHIYLLDLKLAALRHLPTHEDFFAFFGAGRDERNRSNYELYIAPHLDAPTRRFWETNSLTGRFANRRRIDFFSAKGLYEHSRNGYFLRFFHLLARLHGCRPAEIVRAADRDEQERLFEEHIGPFFDSFLMRLVGRLPITMFGLGIPPQQYDELLRDLDEGAGIVEVYRQRARKLAVEYPIEENYFAWQAFARRYDTEHRRAVPEYLKEENYARLKENADRLETRIGPVDEAVPDGPEEGYDRYVLLDAQDWMDAAALTRLWQAIADRSPRGARIIFRTAGRRSPLEPNLPAGLLERFEYRKDVSERLFAADRASIYGGFHLYVLK